MPQTVIIALCWHPGNSLPVSAGGFTRFFEIAKRGKHKLIIFDKYPSLYTSLADEIRSVVQYHIPNLAHFPAVAAAILDRVFSLAVLIKHLLLLPRGKYLVYVPTSELPQLSMAGVVAKFLFRAKLILVNLNVNVFKLDLLISIITHRLADTVITLSQDLKSALAKTDIHADFVNGVGFDTHPYSSIPPDQKQPIAVYIGRHDPQKGVYDLLQIWKKIIVSSPQSDLKLITAGNIPPAYKDPLFQLAASLNIQTSVTFLGSVSETKKISLLRQAKVCLFPSHHEGWGIIPMESLASGTPVVAYDLPVYQESIGKTAGLKLVKLSDLTAFAKTAAGLLTRPPLKFTWKPVNNWDDIARREWEIICSA